MASNCCCGDRCTLKGLPADRHWCPGCKQPIHAVCGVTDETQESIAYMNWCYNCNEGRKMPAQKAMQQPQPSQQKRQTVTRKKAPPQNALVQVPQTELKGKSQSNKPTSTCSKPFKIVVPAQHTDHLIGRKVAFPLDGPDTPTWLNNPILQQYGEEVRGVQYLFGIVSRSKSVISKTPYLIDW